MKKKKKVYKIYKNHKGNIATEKDNIKEIFYRYILMFIITNLFLTEIFVEILSAIFSYISYFILKVFYNITIVSGDIYFGDYKFLIVTSCVTANIYIFFTYIFFSLRQDFKSMFKIWGGAIFVYTISNFIRILLLLFILIKFGPQIFYEMNLYFYHGLTIIMTVLILVYMHRINNLKGIPLLTDLKYLFNLSKFKKKK